MLNKNLRMITLTLLKNRPPHITFPMIAEDTKLSTEWIKSFSKRGAKFDSGSDRIVTLYNYLTKSTLI